jgi:hypothetical protein
VPTKADLSLTMNRILFFTLLFIHFARAGEPSLTVTYQPLNGLGAGSIHIAQVTCHDWYSHSGLPTQIGLISAANVPPTNNPKKATEDLNLASVCGVRFHSDIGDPKAALALRLDATKFAVPDRCALPREQIVRACLECLRRCLPDKLRQTPVTLECSDSDKNWLTKIVQEFNANDRAKVFFTPPE